jgi:hypothetical protein
LLSVLVFFLRDSVTPWWIRVLSFSTIVMKP